MVREGKQKEVLNFEFDEIEEIEPNEDLRAESANILRELLDSDSIRPHSNPGVPDFPSYTTNEINRMQSVYTGPGSFVTNLACTCETCFGASWQRAGKHHAIYS